MNEPWLTALFWLWYPQSPAQYHPGPAPLGCPNRCDPSLSMHRLTRPRMGRGGCVWGGRGGGGMLWSTSSLIHPTIKTLWKTNVCLAKVKALEPGAHPSVCPGFLPFYSCLVFVRASTLPCSFGQGFKQHPGGWDSLPFPTRGTHTVTTANCLDYDNSAWRRRKRKAKKKKKNLHRPRKRSVRRENNRGSNLIIIQVTL